MNHFEWEEKGVFVALLHPRMAKASTFFIYILRLSIELVPSPRFPAGTPPALRASPPCCHGDESWYKRQAGRHDVSQDLHPEARQRQVTSRGGGGEVTRGSGLKGIIFRDKTYFFRNKNCIFDNSVNESVQSFYCSMKFTDEQKNRI